jgi:hypothetical protein
VPGVEAGVGGVAAVVEEVLLAVGAQDVGVPRRERGLDILVRARLASVFLISWPAAMTCAAVGGAVEPYIFMSGRPAVVPMSPMPGIAGAAGVPGFDAMPAMPAGPSGPARAGVITAEVTATTKAGTAARLTAVPMAPNRRTGRAASEGRHRSATHPAIRASSRTMLTTSRPPAGSGWPTSGPIGKPVVRDAT